MKKLIALALALILVLGLAACASNPDAKNDTTPAQNTPEAEAPAENGTSDAPVVHKIGVSIPTLQEERWQNDFNYFTECLSFFHGFLGPYTRIQVSSFLFKKVERHHAELHTSSSTQEQYRITFGDIK